jgi:hypothetical protein
MSGFRKVYPGKDKIRFDGGMNSKFDRSLIEDNQSPSCQNVRFQNGGVETRGGSTKISSFSLGSFVGDGIYTRHTDDGQETMVVFGGAKMQYWTGSTFTSVPSATSVFTAGIRVGAAEQENYLFVGNGSTIPYKYNGDFTRHGIYPPTAGSTVTSNATGSLTGSYSYKITNVNTALVESDVGPVSNTFTAASATLRVTLQTFAVSYGVAQRRIYRTTAGGTTYKRVATVSDHTTTTYDDNIADASLGTNAPTDNGVPPGYNVILYHAGRLFMNDAANPNFLWFSEIDSPFTVASTNFRKVGDATSDLIKGIVKFENHILINCDKSQHILYMPDTDPTNWELVRVQSPYGSKSPYGCFEFESQIMVPVLEGDNFVGFAPVGGAAVTPSATFLTVNTIQSLLMSNPIEPDMFNIQKTYLGNISAITFKNRAYISVTSGDAQTKNNKVWVFDYSLGKEGGRSRIAWSPDTGIEAAQFTVFNNKLYFVTSTEPCYVNEFETTTYNDNGSAINSYFWTKEFTADSGDSVQTHKDFRYVKVLAENSGNYPMNLNYRVNSDSGDGNVQPISLNPGGSLWGTMVFGTDSWGGGSLEEDKKIFLGGTRGERIQFRFSNQNTVNQKFEVHGLRFYFNERGFR